MPLEQHILDTKTLGKTIREARKKQGITQDDVAGLTGVGRRFISDLENGKETAQIGKVLLVLKNLGVAVYAVRKWE